MPQGATTTTTLNVLLVEDSAMLCEMLRDMIDDPHDYAIVVGLHRFGDA